MMLLRSLALLALVSLTTVSCDMFTMKGPFKPYDKKSVLPQDFLYTKYAPLNAWLDTPIRVQILDVPLPEVFALPCLRGLDYRIVSLPKLKHTITMNHMAMTRRQLLWALAQDHQLRMTPVFGENGRASHIDIRNL